MNKNIIFSTTSKQLFGNDKHQFFKEKVRVKNFLLREFSKLEMLANPTILRNIEIISDDIDTPFAQAYPVLNSENPQIDLLLTDKSVCFFQSSKYYLEIYHIYHHELCHCIDYENMCNSIGKEYLPQMDGSEICSLNDLYIDYGYRLWSEYYSYYSCEATKPDKMQLECNLFKQQRIAIKFLREFQKNVDDPTAWFISSKKYIMNFLHSLCCQIGYLHAINLSPCDKFSNLFRDTNLNEFVSRVEKCLLILHMTYPQWTKADNFVLLGKTLLSIYEQFGVIPIEDGEALKFYVNL